MDTLPCVSYKKELKKFPFLQKLLKFSSLLYIITLLTLLFHILKNLVCVSVFVCMCVELPKEARRGCPAPWNWSPR